MPGGLEEPRAPRPRQRKRRPSGVDPRSLDAAAVGEVIEMALSDHTSFESIRILHGLTPDQVKDLMRSQLKAGSYRAWRRRIQRMGDRRAHYK